MRALITIIIILYLLGSKLTFAQQPSMFLIMAYIDKNNQSDYYEGIDYKTYYKLLYKLNNEDLVLVDTLNATDNQYMERLIHFPDYKLFYYVESGIDILENSDKYYFTMFDYQNGDLVFRRYYTGWDTLWTEDSYDYFGFAFLDSNNLYIVNESYIDTSGKFNHLGIDRYFNKKYAGYNEYNNIYEPGISGFQDKFYNSVSFPWGNTSLLKITWDSDYNKMGDFKYQLPEKYKNEQDSIYEIIINNENYLILNSEYRSFTLDTMKTVYVYNKKDSIWEDIKLPGNYIRVRNWKDWLYGMEVRADSIDFIEKYHELIEEKAYREMIFLKKKYNSDNGNPPNLNNYTGKMYLYYIPYKKLIAWNSKDRDSEIIMIINGKIYYRVFDELRRVELDEQKKNINWRSDVLLVKNKDIIPYVHHIFFSKTNQNKCKEIWVNKPNDEK